MHNDSLIRIICDAYMALYKSKNGEQKLYTAIQKVMSSNKVTGLIGTSKFHKIRPTAKNFTDAIISTTYFMFSRPERVVLGSLLAVNRWNDEANADEQLADQGYLKDVAFEILQNGKCHEFLAYLMSSLQTVDQVYQDDFTDDDIDDDVYFFGTHDLLELEYHQKCAVLASLLWIKQGKSDVSPEAAGIYTKTKTLLKLTKEDSQNIKEMSAKGIKYIVDILREIPAAPKTWYTGTAQSILHADASHSFEKKLRYFRTIMESIGMTTELLERVAHKPQFPTGEVLSCFRDAETTAWLDPMFSGETDTQETPNKCHRFFCKDSTWYLDDPRLIGIGYTSSQLSMSNEFCKILDIIAEGDSQVTLTIDSKPFEGAEKLESWFRDEMGNHHYLVRTIKGRQVNLNIWDDNLTDFVFGYKPDDIYLRRTL